VRLISIFTAPRLRTELIELVGRGVRTVTLDLARLDFIDSTGLAVFVSRLKRLREHGATSRFSLQARAL